MVFLYKQISITYIIITHHWPWLFFNEMPWYVDHTIPLTKLLKLYIISFSLTICWIVLIKNFCPAAWLEESYKNRQKNIFAFFLNYFIPDFINTYLSSLFSSAQRSKQLSYYVRQNLSKSLITQTTSLYKEVMTHCLKIQ